MPRPHPRFLSNDSKAMRGVRRPMPVPSPAAGAEWSVKVPGGRMWRILGGQALFTASAAVANRLLGLQVTASGALVYVNQSTFAVVAAATPFAVYQPGTALSPAVEDGTAVPIPFVPQWLEQGDTFGSLTGALQAADQYSAITLVIEELWFTNQDLNDWELAAEHLVHELATGGK